MSTPGSLIGYLGRATSNRAISELRKRSSRASLVTSIDDNSARGGDDTIVSGAGGTGLADESVLEADLQTALRNALTQLQPRTRQIFLLHLDDDLTYSEIAEALTITVETVRMQMYRATKQLSVALKDFISDT